MQPIPAQAAWILLYIPPYLCKITPPRPSLHACCSPIKHGHRSLPRRLGSGRRSTRREPVCVSRAANAMSSARPEQHQTQSQLCKGPLGSPCVFYSLICLQMGLKLSNWLTWSGLVWSGLIRSDPISDPISSVCSLTFFFTSLTHSLPLSSYFYETTLTPAETVRLIGSHLPVPSVRGGAESGDSPGTGERAWSKLMYSCE